MANRISFILASMLLLVAAVLRMWELNTLPPGLHEDEIIAVRIAETAREGSIEVFYNLGGEGHEGLYHIGLAFVTTMIGSGALGYRLLSVWLGLIALAVVYALGRRLFGRIAGLSAMALLAVNFWSVMLSRTVTRETVLPLIIAGVLLSMAISLPVYRRRRHRGDNTSAAAALGLLLSIGLYVHPIGLLTMLFGMIFIAYMVYSRRNMSRRRQSYINFGLLVMIIVSMPYLISTLRIPQLGGIERLTGDNPALSISTMVRSIGGLAIRGDANPLHNVPGRPLFDVITFVLMMTGFTIAASKWREPRNALLLVPLIILSPVFLLAANAPDFINYSALMPLAALLFGLGVNTIIQTLTGYRKLAASAGLLVLIGLPVVMLVSTTRDFFQTWPQDPDVNSTHHARLGLIADYIDRNSPDVPIVVCGWRPDQSPRSASLTDAQTISLMLNRHRAPVRYVDCINALVMPAGGEGQQIILPRTSVLDNARPSVSEWLSQVEPLQVEGMPEDSLYTLNVAESLADTIGRFTTTTPVQYSPEVRASDETPVSPPVQFGGNLTFLGYASDETSYHPGSTVTLATYWRIDGIVPPDLMLFTHVLADPGARPPANSDVIYAHPAYLQNRDVFVQITRIPLPQSLPPGIYDISVGAYQRTSGARLNVLKDGAPYGTRLFLYSITVENE